MQKPTKQDLMPRTEFEVLGAPLGMRKFTVYRGSDVSGVSGTGIVIQGIHFANDKVCIQWKCPPNAGDTQVKDTWKGFFDTHIGSHPENETIITFEDGEQLSYGPKTHE